MPRVTEEIVLLILDTGSGAIAHSLPEHRRDAAVAGAVLMDLALENRIDTDRERLFLVDPAPVGDDLLDPVLLDIAGEAETRDAGYWLRRAAERGGAVRETALRRLVERGVLEAEANGLLFPSRSVARARRYPPAAAGEIVEDVRSRVMRTLFSDDIPDPRDIIVIGLAAACDIFESILSRDELAEARERIDAIARLDPMSHGIGEAIRAIGPPAPPAKTVRPPEEIPEVPGLPVAGNAFRMAGDVREFLADCYREHGPIFRVRAFGYRYIALVGPEANVFAARISGTHLRSHEQYREFGVALGGHRVMLGMDGPEHVRMRKLQTAGYSPKAFESNLELAHDATLRAIDEWPRDRPIGVQRAMQAIVAEQIGLCCTGVSPGEYIDDLVDFLGMVVSINITKRLPALAERLPKYRRANRRLTELYERILEAHPPDRRAGERPDFIDELLEINRTDPQFLPETDLRANVLAPFMVGIDTSATVCAFMLYALLKHPDLLERMRAEVDEMYERGPPTPEGLRKLDVTRRTVAETLRMWPIIPALTRTVSNSFEFGGYRVPAGARVMLGPTVGHRLAECFPDPDRFDIERHARGAQRAWPPGAFAPYGLGRHRCLGSGFSELQVALTMAAIVRETELVLDRPGRPLRIKAAPAPHPDESLRFRLTRRRTDP